jgi:hypothetical protein
MDETSHVARGTLVARASQMERRFARRLEAQAVLDYPPRGGFSRPKPLAALRSAVCGLHGSDEKYRGLEKTYDYPETFSESHLGSNGLLKNLRPTWDSEFLILPLSLNIPRNTTRLRR